MSEDSQVSPGPMAGAGSVTIRASAGDHRILRPTMRLRWAGSNADILQQYWEFLAPLYLHPTGEGEWRRIPEAEPED